MIAAYLKEVASLADHVFQCRTGRKIARPISVQFTKLLAFVRKEVVCFSWPRYVVAVNRFSIAAWRRVEQIELATSFLQFVCISGLINKFQ